MLKGGVFQTFFAFGWYMRATALDVDTPRPILPSFATS